MGFLARAEQIRKANKVSKAFNNNKPKLAVFIATDDAHKNAEEFERVHVDSYKNMGRRPSLPALVALHAKRLGIGENSSQARVLNVIANRAEKVMVEKEPAYHNRFHFVDVVAMTANFLYKHQEYADKGMAGFDKLNKEELMVTLVSAIGHDLDHEGKTNPKDDSVYNEVNSFRSMMPILAACNVTKSSIDKIYSIFLATSPNGGNQFVKEVAVSQRSDKKPSYSHLAKDRRLMNLAHLANNKKLTQMASIVMDADLYASSGAGYKSHMQTSKDLTKEVKASGMDMDFTTLQSSNFFFSKVVGFNGYASNVARKIANPAFFSLRDKVKSALNMNDNKSRLKA